jgi:hypothetical protein
MQNHWEFLLESTSGFDRDSAGTSQTMASYAYLGYRIKDKIKSYAHQEYNNDLVLGQVLNNVMGKLDLFGRRKSRFRKLKNLDSLPLIVQNNVERYQGSLMK